MMGCIIWLSSKKSSHLRSFNFFFIAKSFNYLNTIPSIGLAYSENLILKFRPSLKKKKKNETIKG